MWWEMGREKGHLARALGQGTGPGILSGDEREELWWKRMEMM